ncbi:MAG: Trigger factor [Verrucomicrobiae bacterium]|nr:Trigger factor [Verrucomicrobiae bacterium]
MPVTIENVAPCRHKLRIEVDAVKVAGVRAELLQEFRKQAAIPGFRPGKAPEPMVEKRYAKQLDDEVRQRVIPDGYRDAVKAQKLRVVGQPQIESVNYVPGQPLVFTAAVDTAPEFTLPEYKGIPVTKKEQPVTDEDIAKTVESLREQQADFSDVTGRGVQTGDFAVVNYTAVCDGKPVTELAPDAKTLGEHKDFWLLIAADSFLPGFGEQLVGTQPGEKKQVLIDFAADFAVKPLAGKKATYFVDVTAIKEKKLPELTDEFAKKIGAETVEKLQAEIRKGLEAERDNAVKGELRKQIVDHLLGKIEFELPKSLVEQETRSIVYDLVQENSRRGVPKESLEQKKDEIMGFASQNARERIRTSFILDAIAQAEKITVAENEMEERIVSLAARYRVTPEKLKAQLDERGGLGEIEEQILVGKTLDFLIANAKVTMAQA